MNFTMAIYVNVIEFNLLSCLKCVFVSGMMFVMYVDQTCAMTCVLSNPKVKVNQVSIRAAVAESKFDRNPAEINVDFFFLLSFPVLFVCLFVLNRTIQSQLWVWQPPWRTRWATTLA